MKKAVLKWLDEGAPNREYFHTDVLPMTKLKRNYHRSDDGGFMKRDKENKDKINSLWYYLLFRMAANYHVCIVTDLPMLAPPGNY